MSDGRIVGAEALVRWNHPDRGLLYPGDFVGLAEEAGQIVPLGRTMLRLACAQAQLWQRYGREPYVAVNIASDHFQHQALVADVEYALHSSGLDGTQLVIEITESALLSNLHESRRQMQLLKDLGVRIALDDFGTGYSSLSYLYELPVDVLKIDRSFLSRMGEGGGRSKEMIRAISSLSQALNLSTVSEGVETLAELELVRSLGVDFAQGYYFAKPMDAALFRTHLRRGVIERPMASAAVEAPPSALPRSSTSGR